ncbi:hypothetical protein K474DRAFT_1594242 [Panus rudis PR-1116 ss-1]|nr:hypothetical protein K474DRAFT_1594242 [Panus rudis PR-1116 ss-1]
MNPFTAGGWTRAGARSSRNPWGDNDAVPPSVFGALPSLSPAEAARSMQPDSVTFQFTNFRTTILNCTIVGPQNRVAYRVVTEPVAPSCTILKDNESRNVAMVQWQPNATLEIRGVTPRQRVKEWLPLSSDRSRRKMEVRGVIYAWKPMDGFICLYKVNSTAPRILARIARAPSMVLLEMTQEALGLNLLEPCLVSTVLLVCGHNLD